MILHDLQTELRPIGSLIPYARNARTHSETQVAQIAASIDEFGFLHPVLIDPKGGIIAGHARVLAARKLGQADIPVIVIAGLTENQKRAFILADNKLGLNAGWDEEMLRLELEALVEHDFNPELAGFGEAELEELLRGAAPNGLLDADDAPDPAQEVVSATGDVWILGNHRVLCGDGTSHEELQRLLQGQTCDLVFTDLPYNVDYTGKTAGHMKLANDNLGAAFGDFLAAACQAMLQVSPGPIYICMSSGELHRLHPAFTAAGGHWSTYIIWAKDRFTLGRSDYQRQYEPMLYGWRAGSKHFWCGARNQGDVWLVDKPHVNDLHPTMKPVELIERALENSSPKRCLVLDPFAGSGSTLIACERMDRYARVVEIDPRYVDVIVRRWQGSTGRQASHEQDGRTFEQVAAERAESSGA
jgi:DNA modification methylase